MSVCSVQRGENFKKILPFPRQIVDYLFDNAPDLWRLLYYIKPEVAPLNQPYLTDQQKAEMIVSTPSEMYDTNISVKKNILFQYAINEAFFGEVPQIRIYSGDKAMIDRDRGWCEIIFQIIVPNTQLLCLDNNTPIMDRSDAIVGVLLSALQEKVIPESVVNSPMFMNKSAPDGAGRNTGCQKGTANKNFTVQFVSMSVLV